MERILKSFTALLLALFLLSACGSALDSDDGAVADHDMEVADDAAEAAPEEAQDQDASGGVLEGGTSAAERQVITTASAVVEVDDTREAVRQVVGLATGYGGYVEAREESTDDDGEPVYASVTLRLPQDNLDELIEQLNDYGEVTDLTESAQDVTSTYRDLNARINALETSVDRLIEIMSEADSAEELLQIETTLSERQASLESLQAELNALEDQISLSTVHISFTTEPITEVDRDGFMGGLQSGWNALVGFINGFLVVAGALVPWLAVLAVPGVVVLLLLHRHRKKRAANPRPAASEQPAVQEDPEPGAADYSKQPAGPENASDEQPPHERG
ncbi:DUF4349 domain-containing protein [Nesterenkonia ebinurensis]|uniref:DUF4349 domain-containing protein n=1 Tax=Nesterenkonia ebinurensis TaxID=2608252 RepID=UPI00168A9F4D|nr:DUF4349 domain-containing protein [Nesterenkonia ebinurensis]